ncbi:MAG: hypothetical protein ACNA7H_04320 [Desulfotignum sp.]
MKLSNEPSRPAVILATLVTVLFLVTVHAVAAIDPDAAYKAALDRVEAAASAGDIVVLSTSAYDAAMFAVENEMTIQEACHQIAFVTIMAASGSGQNVQSSVQAAVDGVSNAQGELTERAKAAAQGPELPALELDAEACAIYGLRAAAESLGLEGPEAFEGVIIPEQIFPEALERDAAEDNDPVSPT